MLKSHGKLALQDLSLCSVSLMYQVVHMTFGESLIQLKLLWKKYKLLNMLKLWERHYYFITKQG